jgi:hypothetical protein
MKKSLNKLFACHPAEPLADDTLGCPLLTTPCNTLADDKQITWPCDITKQWMI